VRFAQKSQRPKIEVPAQNRTVTVSPFPLTVSSHLLKLQRIRATPFATRRSFTTQEKHKNPQEKYFLQR
jgi:hypothetical protein